jgi:hypothetical protein
MSATTNSVEDFIGKPEIFEAFVFVTSVLYFAESDANYKLSFITFVFGLP